ncbi:MAG: hypothetical protein RR319_02910 [Bacteroides sp.]
MADNYLEKQYAQYEAKKAAWEKARKLGLIKKEPVSSIQQIVKSDKETNSTKK